MSRVYEARTTLGTFRTQDCTTAEEAAQAVERAGAGSVVEFILERNMPGCLPEMVRKSVSLWTLEAGTWTKRSIFGGTAEGMGEERPGSNAIELRRLAATPFIAEVLTPFGYWNPHDRLATAKLAEKANAKFLKNIPGATLRVRDERVQAA